MEKIGLFDLIDKIASPKTDEKSFRPAENPPSSGGKTFDNPPKSQPSRPQNREKENETLRDPDFGAQPQYMMNAKMQAFIQRHENLKADVPAARKKKRTMKKTEEKRV